MSSAAEKTTHQADEHKTHYRKAFNSPYLSSADIVGPTQLTITRVSLEPDKTKKTKDHFNTAYFSEPEIRPGEKLKPMILNVHNSEVMRDMCGSKFIEDWRGRVTVYVDPGVRFGKETVEGLRLMRGEELISGEQVAEIEKALKETDSDLGAFLKWCRIDELAQMPASKFSRAMHELEKKRAGS